MKKKTFLEKLKARWEIETNWQVFVICLVFAITGSAAVRIANPVMHFAGISKEDGFFIYWPLRIIMIFPVYQVLLIIFGTLLGQFKFFWKMEKKMLGRFVPKKKNKIAEEEKVA
jgi:hypothetical protein